MQWALIDFKNNLNLLLHKCLLDWADEIVAIDMLQDCYDTSKCPKTIQTLVVQV